MIWQNALASGRLLVLDGGTGSELRRRGVQFSAVAWSAAANLNDRQTLVEIHGDYLAAGADIVTANTFATTRFVLAAAGLEAEFRRINLAALEAAVEARDRAGVDATIAASLSCMPPGFDTRAYPAGETEAAAYRELAELFADNGVELVLLEMMQDEEHAARAAAAVEQTGLPYGLGLSCRLDAAGYGLRPFDALDANFEATLAGLLQLEPSFVAVMHTPVEAMLPALARLRRDWPGVLAAYAEIPYPEDPQGDRSTRSSPARFADAARAWIDAGARIVGGCCGTTPEHIQALRALADSI
jgi:homocysteine S-methyltransferase